MAEPFEPGRLLRQARTRAGLTQREVARRAGTSQSVVARIERGQTSPTVVTWVRLLAASGFEPRTELVLQPTAGSHMLDDVPRILRLTPEQRLAELGNISRFEAAARRA